MKRFITVISALLCISVLAACGKKKTIDGGELAEAFNSGLSFSETLVQLDDAGAERYFFINPNDYEELTAYVGTKGTCDEFIIMHTNDTDTASEKLRQHIERLKSEYSHYRPQETAKLDSAFVDAYRDNVVMVISSDSAKAEEVFNNYLKK